MDKDSGSTRFEKLDVWSRAKDLSLEIYQLTSGGPFARDWGLREQIRKAAVSIPSNIAEGQGRFGIKEFRNFLSIANGSTYEVITQIHIARDLKYITPAKAKDLIAKYTIVSRMIKSLRKQINCF